MAATMHRCNVVRWTVLWSGFVLHFNGLMSSGKDVLGQDLFATGYVGVLGFFNLLTLIQDEVAGPHTCMHIFLTTLSQQAQRSTPLLR
jgi:hypothetical protein